MNRQSRTQICAPGVEIAESDSAGKPLAPPSGAKTPESDTCEAIKLTWVSVRWFSGAGVAGLAGDSLRSAHRHPGPQWQRQADSDLFWQQLRFAEKHEGLAFAAWQQQPKEPDSE